jgi:hypothetical protein
MKMGIKTRKYALKYIFCVENNGQKEEKIARKLLVPYTAFNPLIVIPRKERLSSLSSGLAHMCLSARPSSRKEEKKIN